MEMIYESIEDLPIWNWNKIHDKGDLTYLRINRINGHKTSEEHKSLSETWDKIFSEYIDRFGFSDSFLSIMDKKKQIAFYKIEKMVTGDETIDTMIEICENELRQMSEIKKGADFWQSKSSIEKMIGFALDAKKTSVIEFYSHIENLKSEGKIK